MKNETGVDTRKVALAFAAIYLIWGSTFLAIQIGIETIPPFFMAGMRFFSAGILMYAWARIGGARPPSLREWKSAAIIGVALFLFSNGGVTWAETRVASGIAALIVATVPLWISLLEWLRGDNRPTVLTTTGLIIGFGGVAVLLAPQLISGHSEVDPLGVLVLLVACFSWANGSLYIRKAKLPESQIVSAAAQMIAGSVALFLAGLLAGEARHFDVLSVSARSWVSVAYLSIFGSVIGFTAYAWLIRNVPPSRVATYAYVNPVIAILLGWGFAGEKLGPAVFLSGAMIVVSVILTVSSRSSSKKPETRKEVPAPEIVRFLRTPAATSEPKRSTT